MNSWSGLIANVSADVPPGNAVPVVVPGTGGLQTADAAIWWVGLALVAGAAGVWLARGRRDPLRNAPQRPNRLLPEHVLVLMLAFVTLSMVAGWVARQFAATRDLELNIGNGVQLAGGIACLILGATLFDGGLNRFLLGRGRTALRVVQGVALLLAGLTLCSLVYEATEALIRLAWPGYQPPEHSVVQALRDNAEPVWPLRLGAVLVAPLAEECFFRGLVQTVLRKLLGKPWPAVLITAVLFGLAHSQQPQVIPALTVLGVLLGVGYERTGSLVTPMVVHSLFNLKTLVWEALGQTG